MKVSHMSLRNSLRLGSFSRPFIKPCCSPVWCRRSYSASNEPPIDFEAIKAEMLGRPPQLTWTIVSPTNSTLLSIALADFLPKSCHARTYQLGATSVEKVNGRSSLPPGHHFVYFPLQKTASQLGADGTDPFHSPGGPFVRRMWASGSLEYTGDFRLDFVPALCSEHIEAVTVKGSEGQEKIFVDVVREYKKKSLYKGPGGTKSMPLSRMILERRTLVFMRGLSPEQVRENLAKAERDRARVVQGMFYVL